VLERNLATSGRRAKKNRCRITGSRMKKKKNFKTTDVGSTFLKGRELQRKTSVSEPCRQKEALKNQPREGESCGVLW